MTTCHNFNEIINVTYLMSKRGFKDTLLQTPSKKKVWHLITECKVSMKRETISCQAISLSFTQGNSNKI